MTQQQAYDQLPADAKWSCSFGYPGEDRYCEYWCGTNGQYYVIIKDGPCWSFREGQP